MYQHPIPQNITTYQFRLIGDMTLKQFLELCIGVGLAITINATNLFTPIKFTLIVFSVASGFALAFMPIEERPLDQWIVAFIKSIYSPTHFIWFKKPMLPAYFSYTAQSSSSTIDSEEMINAAILRKREGLSTFLQTLSPNQSLSKLEAQEVTQLNSVAKLFENDPISSPSPQSTLNQPATPYSQLNIDATNLTATPAEPPPTKKSTPHLTTVPKEVVVAPTPLISVAPSTKPEQNANTPTTPLATPAEPQPESKSDAVAKKVADTTVTATTSNTLPFPSTPTTPNTIVGMVLDSQEKIIDNAIIEIRDSNGIPVRATKTNRLGQFFSTTPLKNGTYALEVEKEGFRFAIIKLELNGKILPPLKIQAN